MNALRMIARCARRQREDAAWPTGSETGATASTEQAVPGSTEFLPEEDMGNGERGE